MPPGKLDLSKSIFAQPPPELELKPTTPGRRLTISEELEALKGLTASQEAAYAAKKAEVDEQMGKQKCARAREFVRWTSN